MRPLLLLVLALTLGLGGLTACDRETPNEVVPGVRLGMAPRDVRDRFDGGGEGTWQTKVGGGAGASDDTVLEWSASGEKTRATRARFEFHLGMLVAVRAHLRDPIGSQRVDLTPKTVTVRTPEAGGTEVTILARDCPTHHDEAEALAAKAGAVR
jgi:hypothetical protein